MATATESDPTRLEREILRALGTQPAEARLESYTELATLALREIELLSHANSCDPEAVGRALDAIDFALGQAVVALHEQ